MTFEGRDEKTVVVKDWQGVPRAFTVLHMFEFNSERKRMSVIVEEVERRRLFMFTKGADSSVIPRYKNVA